MGTQRFYLPSGKEYIEYSVEDVDYDYANVVIAPIDDALAVGIGYILREEVTVGISLDTDVATTVKRWFAYDAGSCGGNPGTRVGNVNAGYATMESAINGLLGEYANVSEAIKADVAMPGSSDTQYSVYGNYDQAPLLVDVWAETSRDGVLHQSVTKEISKAGGIHMLTSNLIHEIAQRSAKLLWSCHDIFVRDGVQVLMSVSVDTPTDICGNRVMDRNKPFDGMTLSVAIQPSRQSVMPGGSVSLSVIDVENSSDANVLIGTSMVNGNDYGTTDHDLSIGVVVDSFVSEATTQEQVEMFTNRMMLMFLNSLMRCVIMDYQSRFEIFNEIASQDNLGPDAYAPMMQGEEGGEIPRLS